MPFLFNANVKFYTDESKGIFELFRKYFTPIPASLVTIESPDYLRGSGFYCQNSGIYGREAYSLIDGNSSTAWANDKNETEYSYFTIDFKDSKFSLQGYKFDLLCSPTNDWIIQGSNDNSIWDDISIKTNQNLDEDSTVSYSFSPSKFYRYFKYVSIKSGRIHLHNIEFYGIYNSIASKCYQKYENYCNIKLNYLLIIISNK